MAVLVVMSGLFMLYRNRIQKKQNIMLQMKNQELAEAITIQEQLRKEAQTDFLTGLKSKSAIEDCCQYYLDRYPAQKHSILMIDLDNFKDINDICGHLWGDAVLTQFGRVLLESFDHDQVVGRIGGDEFLVFMPCIEDQGQVEARIKTFYANLQEIVETFSEVPIGCSIGAIISDSPHQRFNELFLRADQAMYQAKSAGKNTYVIALAEERG